MIDLKDYLSRDATAMALLVQSGEVSSDELVECCLALVERTRPTINAIAELAAPIPAVAASEGPFAGVPFAVKELLDAPGLHQTFGSRLFAGNPGTGQSPYAQALASTGLRTVCSTTSSEFGLLGSTETQLHGMTRNPLDRELSAAGSSGGAAAAVAAGIVPMAHASDAGGSIRVPASVTGLFGFKPSAQRCPSSSPDGGALASLVVDHVISRTVRDSRRMLIATQRRDPAAPYPPLTQPLGPPDRRLRIGVLTTTLKGRNATSTVIDVTEDAARLCEDQGHHVARVAAPAIDGEALSDAFFTSAAMAMAAMADIMTPLLGRRPGPDELEPFTLELIDWAAALPASAADDARTAMVDATRRYLDLFAQVDAILSPTLAIAPWPLGTLAPDLGREELIARTGEIVGFTPIHNVAGCPAMSVPIGEHDGLPIGVHFAATPGDDETLMDLAVELESVRPWPHRHPAIAAAASES